MFARLDIKELDDLTYFTEEMRAIYDQAVAINRENDRLAAIYDGNYSMVKTYQDIITDRPDLDNKDVEATIKMIYDEIKDGIDTSILVVQGRDGFIDQTKKKVTKDLLKTGLYKRLGLNTWLQKLLSDMYTNLQNFR